ncbi:MAG: type II toxin-antitoxin system HicB family antitoxin [Lautropia sp.]|nr:type II toxin-antitoxin system HicB family antitoxin [Lautropia sp.]
MSYAVVIEQRGSWFRAYVPDLPGCTATGNSLAEAEAAVREVMRVFPGGCEGKSTQEPAQASGYLWVNPHV